MIIGKFEYDEILDTYHGYILTLSLEFYDVRLVPMQTPEAKGPSYRAMSYAYEKDIEIGAGRKRSGGLLSVELDDPALVAPIDAVLLPHESGGFALVWNRTETAKAA